MKEDETKKCPKCGRWTVKYDSYFKRYRCMMRDCSWIETVGFKEPVKWGGNET